MDPTLDLLSKVLIGLVAMLGVVVPAMLGVIGVMLKTSADSTRRHEELTEKYQVQFENSNKLVEQYQKQVARTNDLFDAFKVDRAESEVDFRKVIEDSTLAIRGQTDATRERTEAAKSMKETLEAQNSKLDLLNRVNDDQKSLIRDLIQVTTETSSDTTEAFSAVFENTKEEIRAIPARTWETKEAQALQELMLEINTRFEEMGKTLTALQREKSQIDQAISAAGALNVTRGQLDKLVLTAETLLKEMKQEVSRLVGVATRWDAHEARLLAEAQSKVGS